VLWRASVHKHRRTTTLEAVIKECDAPMQSPEIVSLKAMRLVESQCSLQQRARRTWENLDLELRRTTQIEFTENLREWVCGNDEDLTIEENKERRKAKGMDKHGNWDTGEDVSPSACELSLPIACQAHTVKYTVQVNPLDNVSMDKREQGCFGKSEKGYCCG